MSIWIILFVILAGALVGVHVGKLPQWVQSALLAVVLIAAILAFRGQL